MKRGLLRKVSWAETREGSRGVHPGNGVPGRGKGQEKGLEGEQQSP